HSAPLRPGKVTDWTADDGRYRLWRTAGHNRGRPPAGRLGSQVRTGSPGRRPDRGALVEAVAPRSQSWAGTRARVRPGVRAIPWGATSLRGTLKVAASRPAAP